MSEVSSGYFPEKYRILIFEAQNGKCCVDGCYSPIEEFHHGLPNTVVNRKLFPMFIKSVFNMFGMCRVHHVAGDRPKIRPVMAEVFETYLQDVKKGKVDGDKEES